MRAPAAGLSYIEVMVALVLLAICAVPAADAIRSGLRATEAGAVQARELRCVKNTMETVAAESYDNLWKAIQGPTTPSSYSLAADPAPGGECGPRNVYISKYVHYYGGATGQVLAAGDPAEDTLLIVTVSGTDGAYPLTTLVDR
ncbi:type II secretion system protein J [Massilia sp. 9I]|uniref:PulJ/GspJ family protein n=1 Tax=Massilia sp. 9I TaxID=2653152 RepID=UPI0012EFC2D6|nr:hypothetical protein [Massilia sp. 9I]VXC28471.1 conserved hypothetical protein [Massilia sp. 9I]